MEGIGRQEKRGGRESKVKQEEFSHGIGREDQNLSTRMRALPRLDSRVSDDNGATIPGEASSHLDLWRKKNVQVKEAISVDRSR